MITEDYVSFETAKLLMESGFDVETSASIKVFAGHNYEVNGEWVTPEKDTIIPTLQMAMKWLRKMGWFIHIDVIREVSCWTADIQDIKNDVAIYAVEEEFPDYESACKAAIKYCLENLI